LQVLKFQGTPYALPLQGRMTREATAELVAVILVALKEHSLKRVDTVGPSGLFSEKTTLRTPVAFSGLIPVLGHR
jgi:hypothetical protein